MSNARELAELGGSYGTGGFVGMKNRIINGGMTIDQRNAGASVTPADAAYTLDRWRFSTSQASKFTVQQSTTAPAGFRNSMLITVASAVSPSAGDAFGIFQPIEGFNFADMAFGSASAQTISISFWARSSLTGTFSGMLFNSAANRVYCFTYTINSANTFEYKTVTVTGDTTGTWLTDNGVGLSLYFDLGSGSNAAGTANVWSSSVVRRTSGSVQLVATAGATLYITGVQLEKGSTATSFDFRSYGTELALCQRYCVNYNSANANGSYYRYFYGECVTSSQIQGNIPLPVPMRATPSLTTPATAISFAVYSRVAITDCSAVPVLSGDGASNQSAAITANTTAALTQGSAGSLMSRNNTTSYLLLTAEL